MVAFMGLGAGTMGAIAMTRVLPIEGIGWSGSGIFLDGVSRTDNLTYFAGSRPLDECSDVGVLSPLSPGSESRSHRGAALRVESLQSAIDFNLSNVFVLQMMDCFQQLSQRALCCSPFTIAWLTSSRSTW
jgi:hypothetical protein